MMTKTIGADAAVLALKGWTKGEGERDDERVAQLEPEGRGEAPADEVHEVVHRAERVPEHLGDDDLARVAVRQARVRHREALVQVTQGATQLIAPSCTVRGGDVAWLALEPFQCAHGPVNLCSL